MSIIKKILFITFISLFFQPVNAEEILKKIGKYKDWESYKLIQSETKVCFAQSEPIVRAPKKYKRDESRLFVSFRTAENIIDEISLTSGYEFKVKEPVVAKSGKKAYDFFSKGNFAWIADNTEQKKMIRTMKKSSRLMIVGMDLKGNQTTDHYSMMGFTKAYNSAKKNCS